VLLKRAHRAYPHNPPRIGSGYESIESTADALNHRSPMQLAIRAFTKEQSMEKVAVIGQWQPNKQLVSAQDPRPAHPSRTGWGRAWRTAIVTLGLAMASLLASAETDPLLMTVDICADWIDSQTDNQRIMSIFADATVDDTLAFTLDITRCSALPIDVSDSANLRIRISNFPGNQYPNNNWRWFAFTNLNHRDNDPTSTSTPQSTVRL